MDDIVLAHADHGLAEQSRRIHQAGVDVLGALGGAGRARGIEPESGFVGMGVDGREFVRRLGQKVRKFKLLALGAGADDHDMSKIRRLGQRRPQNRQKRRRNQQHGGARIREHVGVLVRCQQRVEADRHDSRADSPEKGHGPVDRVEHGERDALLPPYAEVFENVREFATVGRELAVANGTLGVDEGELVAPARGHIPIEQILARIVSRHCPSLPGL